ncbi:MAG: hypothetical protein KF832_28070 [Caldilineaceae bacterium]|nr:hypothetical protein [Caldilineaceae bacterium]
MMNLLENYQLDKVWEAKTPALQAEIMRFWLHTGALSSHEEAENRVNQVIFVARTKAEQQIVAISSVYIQVNQQLGYPCYYFRCFVEERHRRASLASQLLLATQQELNARFGGGENPQVIGMVVEVQNEALRQFRTEAIWPHSGFVYIGRNGRGDPVRVAYFDGARIT